MPEQTQPLTLGRLREGSGYLNATDFRQGATLALLSGRHMLTIGPPGENKTGFAEELFRALTLPEEQTHIISGYKGAGEEILVNYLHPGKMDEGALEYLPGKSLLNVVLAYVDEVGALSRVAQQALLQIMQSRRFSRAGMDHKLPLDTLFAGGNTPPEDPAVRDRFAIQVPLQLPRKLYQALVQWEGSRDDPQEKGSISWENVLKLRARAKALPLTEEAQAVAVKLAEQFRLTPRRVVEALLPAARVWALQEGRRSVTALDVVDAAPYVVMHDGPLTVERMTQVRNDLAHYRQDAELGEIEEHFQRELGPILSAVKELRNNEQLNEARWLEEVRKLNTKLKEMPNPDNSSNKAKAEIITRWRAALMQCARELMSDLGI